VVFPDFQPMRVSEETVCIYLFRQNPVLTSLHVRSPVHVVPPQGTGIIFVLGDLRGGEGAQRPVLRSQSPLVI
jgi:hypothetical protein